MTKTNILIGFLLLSIAFNSNAYDSNRIDQLENEIQSLKIRVSNLESLLSKQGSAREYGVSSEGWKSISSWRKLNTGMSPDDVENLLGAPQRVDGGNIAFWHYRNGGEVTFMRGHVHSWQEPKQ